MRLIRSIAAMLLTMTLLSSLVFGQAWTEQQTINELVNGSQGWVASYGTAEQQVTTNGYLAVGGVGGAGQYFTMNQKSQYQIATLTGVKSGSSWAGFGVTYYSSSWNELSVQYKEIKANAASGDSSIRYSIGLAPPSNAAFAYVWIWNNNGSGYVQAGDFKVVNYFPQGNFSYDPSAPAGSTYTQTLPSWRNRIINGNFETNRNAQNGDKYEGDEMWNVVGSDDSVYWASTGTFTNVVYGLRMGSKTETNLIYQTVGDIQSGEEYSFKIVAGRLQNYGPNRAPVVAGVDFYDASGNKISDVSRLLDNNYSTGRYSSGNLPEVINFTVPSGTERTVVWVWADATGSYGDAEDATIAIHELAITPREYEPPQFELVRALDVTTSGSSAVATIKITDNYEVDLDSLGDGDFEVYRVGGGTLDLEYIGPNIFYGSRDEHSYRSDALTAADNGTYNIYYKSGEISDLSGNTLYLESTYVGSFNVQIE